MNKDRYKKIVKLQEDLGIINHSIEINNYGYHINWVREDEKTGLNSWDKIYVNLKMLSERDKTELYREVEGLLEKYFKNSKKSKTKELKEEEKELRDAMIYGEDVIHHNKMIIADIEASTRFSLYGYDFDSDIKEALGSRVISGKMELVRKSKGICQDTKLKCIANTWFDKGFMYAKIKGMKFLKDGGTWNASDDHHIFLKVPYFI